MAGFFKKVRFDEGKVLEEEALTKESSGRRVSKGRIMVDGEVVDQRMVANRKESSSRGSFVVGEQSVDSSIEKVQDKKPIDYLAITNDPYEMVADEVVEKLIAKFGNAPVGDFVSNDPDTVRDSLSCSIEDTLEKSTVWVDEMKEIISEYSKDANKNDSFESMKKTRRITFPNNIKTSPILRNALVSSGLLSEDNVDYVFGTKESLLKKGIETDEEMKSLLKNQKRIIDFVNKDDMLRKQLRMYGKEFRMLSSFGVGEMFSDVSNVTLPTVKFVVTERGIFLLWEVILPGAYSSDVEITTEGDVFFNKMGERIESKKAIGMCYKMNILSSNLEVLIMKELGRRIRVTPIGLFPSRVSNIHNNSRSKFVTYNTLYEELLGYTDTPVLDGSGMDELYEWFEGINVSEVRVSISDYTKDLPRWENNLNVYKKLSEVRRGIIKSLTEVVALV